MKTGTNEHDAQGEHEATPPALGEPVEPAPHDVLVGTRIDGRYRVDGVLGRGGMAVVYAGEHLELQRTVAIKVLDEVGATDAGAVERFLLEARTASSLTHANIVSVSDLGRLADGRPFLVMPMIGGADLATVLMQEGPMPAHRVALMLRGVASALDLIHAKGLLHRDIKSENLMHVVHEDGTESVLVLDFGIASACLSRMGQREGTWSGTPEFMPPEALVGEQPDRRADVYALATVAFELISGRLPFDCDDLPSMVRQKTEGQPRTLSDVSGAHFDPALEEVVARGLARLPEERYFSAGEFIAELEAVSAPAAHEPVPRLTAATGSRRGRTLVRGVTPGSVSAVWAAQRGVPRGTRPIGSRSPGRHLESGTRAIPGRTTPRGEEPDKDPWLLTWSLPKPDGSPRSSRPPVAAAEGGESLAQSSQPPPAPSPAFDDEQAAERARQKRRTGRVLRAIGYGVLGAVFLGGAMVVVNNLSEQSTRKGATKIAAPRARAGVTEPAAEPEVAAVPEAQPAHEIGDAPVAPAAEAPRPSEPVAAEPAPEPSAEVAPPEHASSRDTARASHLTLEASRALKKGDAQSALENIERALQLDSRYAPAWRGKGLILDSLGHTREAADAYREFLKLRNRGDEADKIRKRLWQLSPR